MGALKRLSAHFLGMGKTRLELASIELAQLRQTTIALVVWSVLAALVIVVGSGFVAAVVVAYFWESHPYSALLGCAVFYIMAGILAVRKVFAISREEPPLFEATLAELERDRESLAQSMKRSEGDAGE